jgi:hypothetical protein
MVSDEKDHGLEAAIFVTKEAIGVEQGGVSGVLKDSRETLGNMFDAYKGAATTAEGKPVPELLNLITNAERNTLVNLSACEGLVAGLATTAKELEPGASSLKANLGTLTTLSPKVREDWDKVFYQAAPSGEGGEETPGVYDLSTSISAKILELGRNGVLKPAEVDSLNSKFGVLASSRKACEYCDQYFQPRMQTFNQGLEALQQSTV